jgi:hypothetical protein
MAGRKVLGGFAVLALGAGITASVATASSPCSYPACSNKIAASGLTGQARGACIRRVMADCRAGLCSCTGGSPPCSCVCGDGLCGPAEDCSTCPQDCGLCPTTTTTTTIPCSLCFVTVTDQCLGPCSQQSDCGIEPNVLCLPVTEIQRIGITCECPTTTTTSTPTTSSSCPPATAPYCGAADCGPGGIGTCSPDLPALCPQGMTCTPMGGTTCGCTGDTIPCGDPRLSGLTCNFCKWGTCPPGMTCGGVPKTNGCGFDCACQ